MADDRNKNLKEAVKLRESGELGKSLDLFNKVFNLDVKSKHFKGQVDVLGHIRIVYSHLAEGSKTKSEKEKFVKSALDYANKTIDLIKAELPKDIGLLAISKVHLSDALIAYSDFANNGRIEIHKALNLIVEGLENFPGSIAHRAWALNRKAQVMHLLGNSDDALKFLKDGEIAIFEGYDEEIKNKDGAMKIKVWLTGLWLTATKIYKESNKKILAQFYVEAVINFDDPEGTLTLRKQQAERLLEEIKKMKK